MPASLVLLGLALGGCGQGSGADEAARAGAIEVAATTGVAADIVSQVVGKRGEVAQVVPDGVNPHGYVPGARQQHELTESDLLVLFHPRLEEALPIDAVERSFALADHVGEPRAFGEVERIGEEDEHGHEADEHGHGEDGGGEGGDERDRDHGHRPDSTDPHVWLDPTAVAAAVPELAEELAAIDPDGADGYRERARRYAAELAELDRELAEILDPIPQGRRKLVTSHEVLGYFAARYGFELVGAPFGLSPEAEASAGRVAELIAAVEDEGVPAVFAQRGDDPKVLRQIAEEAGVEVVDELLVESLGEEAGSYVEMLRHTTTRIAAALAP